jgi:hypothetical protein
MGKQRRALRNIGRSIQGEPLKHLDLFLSTPLMTLAPSIGAVSASGQRKRVPHSIRPVSRIKRREPGALVKDAGIQTTEIPLDFVLDFV